MIVIEIFKLIAVAVAGLLWLTWLVLRLQEAGVHPVRYVLDQYGRLGKWREDSRIVPRRPNDDVRWCKAWRN